MNAKDEKQLLSMIRDVVTLLRNIDAQLEHLHVEHFRHDEDWWNYKENENQ